MLFRMLPKRNRGASAHLFGFRAMLFRMLPKHEKGLF